MSLCTIFFILLTIHIYLSFNKSSICPTDGCKIAASYAVGGEKLFPVFGSIFFFIVLVIFWLYSKKRKSIFEYALWLLILCALSFDGVLIGYLVKINVFCALCISVASSFVLLLIFFSLYTEKYIFIGLGILIWISSFLGINFLKLNSPFMKPPDIKESVMIHIPAKGKVRFHADLFVSLHCIHCYDVLFNLAKAKPYEGIEWNVHFMDISYRDMSKISQMLRDKDLKKDPFGVILKYRAKKDVSEIKISKDIMKRLESAREFFKYRGFKGVPLLIVRTNTVEITIVGDRSIGGFLMKEGIVKGWYMLKMNYNN